jgi:hypothetical protein
MDAPTDTAHSAGAPPGTEPAAAADRIADLIDGCVLPQRLELRFAGGARLSLAAANRRLAEPPVLGGGPAHLSEGLAPTPFDEAAAPRLRAALEALCADQGGFTVVAGPMTDTAPGAVAARDGAGTGGIAALSLRTGTAQVPPTIEAAAAAFLALDTIAVRAAIWCDDNAAPTLSGTPEAAEALRAWAMPVLDRLLDPRFALAGSFETDGAYVMAGGAAAASGHVLIACRLGRALAVALEGEDMTATARAWQAAARPA